MFISGQQKSGSLNYTFLVYIYTVTGGTLDVLEVFPPSWNYSIQPDFISESIKYVDCNVRFDYGIFVILVETPHTVSMARPHDVGLALIHYLQTMPVQLLRPRNQSFSPFLYVGHLR